MPYEKDVALLRILMLGGKPKERISPKKGIHIGVEQAGRGGALKPLELLLEGLLPTAQVVELLFQPVVEAIDLPKYSLLASQ